MARAIWKFILCNSKDMSNVGELTQARGRQISMVLNRPGSLSFNIPMNDDLGQQIYPHVSGVKAYRIGSAGTRLVWSGFVMTIDEDVANNRMTVNCVGWLSRLSKRLLHMDKIYATTDDAAIIQDLLGHVNALTSGEHTVGTNSIAMAGDGYVERWPLGSSPNLPTWIKWNGTLPNEGLGGATAYTAATRNQTYTRYQTNIQQAIQALTEIENGCDIDIAPDTRLLSVYRRYRRVLPSVIFGFQWGPHNISQFNRQLDGSTLANYGLATGVSGVTGVFVDDASSQLLYGPSEEVYALSDVTSTSILGAYAGAEIVLKKDPRQIYSITPFPWTPDSAVPEPFVDYRIGDQVAFKAVAKPRISIDQQVRIFGISVSIDEESNEKMGQIQVYPGG